MIELDSPQGGEIIAKLLSIHAMRGGGNLADTIGGVVTGGLSIGNSRTAKQVRTKLDRMGAGVIGVPVSNKGKWVKMFPARIRTTSNRAMMASSYEFGFTDSGVNIDEHFKIRVVGGKRGRGLRGLSVRIGKQSVEFPYAYLRGQKALEWSIRSKKEFRLRTWSAKYYIEKAGGLSAVEEYAKQRLMKNTRDGLGYMLSKFLEKYRGNR